MRLALTVGVATVAVATALAVVTYRSGGWHVAATEFSSAASKGSPGAGGAPGDASLGDASLGDASLGDASLGDIVRAIMGAPARSADPDAVAVADARGTWGGGTISTEGDIGAADRARFADLAASHRGERPEQPVVLHWYFDEVGAPVVDTNQVAETAAAVFRDPRGWSFDGGLNFVRVDNAEEADFVLLVAEAAEIPYYSDECVSWQTGEPDASCTVGNLVIINDLRWRDGALGDAIPLADFRIHEINHEVGHWLGQGHFSCLGGAAAVNQQQFRSLAGCQPNAWPLPWEKAMVAARFGLWPSLGAFEPYDTVEAPWAEARNADAEPAADETRSTPAPAPLPVPVAEPAKATVSEPDREREPGA